MSRGSVRSRYIYRNVRSVPASIKLAVFDEAIKRSCTMSDVIGTILAEKFGGTYVTSGERSIGVDFEGTQFRIQIPLRLSEKLWKQARLTGETESSVVLSTVAEYFGLEHTPVKKGRKRAAA